MARLRDPKWVLLAASWSTLAFALVVGNSPSIGLNSQAFVLPLFSASPVELESTGIDDERKQEVPVEVDDPANELRSGLVAEYRSLDPATQSAKLTRIDPKPASTWGSSSPHPRLPPGPFEVVWTGLIDIRTADRLKFSAIIGGEVTVMIGKTKVLEGRGTRLDQTIGSDIEQSWKAGLYPVQIRYRATAGVPARLQLWWEGRTFSREPWPASRLKHLIKSEPEAVAREARIEVGRLSTKQLGCAQCHSNVFPSIEPYYPGPTLTELGERIEPEWLMQWLDDPVKLRPSARMPSLFTPDRQGYTERWLVTNTLLKRTKTKSTGQAKSAGDHRSGKQAFLGTGCIACHEDPEGKEKGKADPQRFPIGPLRGRTTPDYLTGFLAKPTIRYPDGRMPQLPLPPVMARDIAAYLFEIAPVERYAGVPEPTPEEIDMVRKRLGVADAGAVGQHLLAKKGCIQCHSGLEKAPRANISWKKPTLDFSSGCLSSTGLPRYRLDDTTRQAIVEYLQVSREENHPSPFETRQRLLESNKCLRCHQRDSDRPSPLEEIGRTLWTPHLYRLPFQRTPRLTQASAKFTQAYLHSAIRDGVSGVQPDWYSYRMPHYGEQAGQLVQALAEGDGEVISEEGKSAPAETTDPNLTALGPTLVGFHAYGCVTCHLWDGKSLSAVEPGSVGPDLTTIHRRIQRSWFEQFLDDPQRIYPGSPMPSIFRHGEPASIGNILSGDAKRQKEALWGYLAKGKAAPSPKPKEPLAVVGPQKGEPPYVVQIPVQLPSQALVEGMGIWYGNAVLVLYDVGSGQLCNVFTNAKLLRQSNTWRTYQVEGAALVQSQPMSSLKLLGPKGAEAPKAVTFVGYDRLTNGALLKQRYQFDSGVVDWSESVRLIARQKGYVLSRELHVRVPEGSAIELAMQVGETAPKGKNQDRPLIELRVEAAAGKSTTHTKGQLTTTTLIPEKGTNSVAATIEFAFESPEQKASGATTVSPVPVPTDEGMIGPLDRPGYRAIIYPRPKLSTGEDLVMPSALAASPRDGRLYVASLKQGDLFVLDDPQRNGKNARFVNYARGLYQDCFGLMHDGQALHVLHRRNLSRVVDTDGDGLADRVERVSALPHAIGNAYDWAYGLVKERQGSFLWTLAPHANASLTGSGSLVRFMPRDVSAKMEEIAFGFRNPLGWSTGPEGEVFFTDNQGDWVAANKLCHIIPGHYYGYPNAARPEFRSKPIAKTAVWVPYEWAKSINGLTYDASAGKFGPFAGQFFMAELMHGGAIVRAHVERVNGVYQGACFPFWPKGLLGPLAVTFDPQGRLWVGSVTMPGWIGQPDRGALFRLDYTGATPFEMQTINVLPTGFRIVFTKPVDPIAAAKLDSYRIQHYRYEYTGAYGSPELDRVPLAIKQVLVHRDRLSVELITDPLQPGRAYALSAPGARSEGQEALVHETGVYTLNEIPSK